MYEIVYVTALDVFGSDGAGGTKPVTRDSDADA